MDRDDQRIESIRRAMREAGMTALLCTLPSNVLLASGYWPVVGTAVALVGERRTIVIAPEDEESFARDSWADDVLTFKSGSLKKLTTAMDVMPPLVKEAARELGIGAGRVGFEASDAYEPASYVAMHVYGAGRLELLSRAIPDGEAAGADAMLAKLKSVKTPREIENVRTACRIARETFVKGVEHVREGLSEIEAAARFEVPLADPQVPRSGGHVAFVSGKNSAKAYGAYEVSRTTRMSRGDLVLVQCNSHAGGFWTDLTRIYCIGAPDGRKQQTYDAIFAAREAALREIRPGVRACDVDRAARDVLTRRGFGENFKHPTGHGVGFAAINHEALPRLHPKSDETLRAGMVFNVEPGIYLEGTDGMRHCDMVAVTDDGCELLTPFQCDQASMVVS